MIKEAKSREHNRKNQKNNAEQQIWKLIPAMQNNKMRKLTYVSSWNQKTKEYNMVKCSKFKKYT